MAPSAVVAVARLSPLMPGATLLGVSVALSPTGAFTPSRAVSVRVNVPSSVELNLPGMSLATSLRG